MVAKALEQFGFLPEPIDKQALETTNQVIRIGAAPNRIEILTGIDGLI